MMVLVGMSVLASSVFSRVKSMRPAVGAFSVGVSSFWIVKQNSRSMRVLSGLHFAENTVH